MEYHSWKIQELSLYILESIAPQTLPSNQPWRTPSTNGGENLFTQILENMVGWKPIPQNKCLDK